MTDPTLHRLALGSLLASFPGATLPAWAQQLLQDGLAGYVLFGHNIPVTDRAAEPAPGSAGGAAGGDAATANTVTPDTLAADTERVRQLVRQIHHVRPDTIVGIDEEGGDVTRLAHAEGSRYPGNAALGAVGDPDLTRKTHHAIGAELRHLGINLNLAPSVDVNSSDDNPIIGTRSFGTDPRLVAQHASAAVAGLQAAGVAACAKHFPGHGATVADSHHELPTVDVPLAVLRERELLPFRAAISAGARAVMTAHIRVPTLTGEQPATLSSPAITDLLRGELGFTGAILTDALEMRGVSAVIGVPESAVRALAAGADLLCVGARVDAPLTHATAAAIVAAVRDGRLPATRLEQAAHRAAALVNTPPSDTSVASTFDPTVAASRSDRGAGAAAITNGAELGLNAARRALRIEGTLPRLRRPWVVQLESPATIAAGERPWGIAPYLLDAADAELIRISPHSDVDITRLTASGHRQVVVVSRDTHRRPHARSLVEHLTAHHSEVVLVEMGWPTSWRPAGLLGYLATYGASQASARAAAEALLDS